MTKEWNDTGAVPSETVPEIAAIVALCTNADDADNVEASFDELERLIETAGGSVFARLTQMKAAPDVRTMIGSGKVSELRELCETNGITLVVFDCDLSPSQIRNLEDALGEEVRVIDRSMLILDIFALHAASGEGKLQVELAQLKYTIPRLTGKGTALSRLGGGIGTRGPGESQLETDKRHLQRRIYALQKEIAEMEKNRKTQRKQRERSGTFRVAIAGYTNAGKSTLLNALTGAGILAEDKLFATLDPTTRKYLLPGGDEILLTDTVGFIRNLPHHLISAFRSTLEEVAYSDMILLLIDAADPEYRNQLTVTQTLIEELGAGDKPVLYVMNKSDLAVGDGDMPVRHADNIVSVSAKTGAGLTALVQKIDEIAHAGTKEAAFLFPYQQQGKVSELHEKARVTAVSYEENGVLVHAVCDARTLGAYAAFRSDNGEANDNG